MPGARLADDRAPSVGGSRAAAADDDRRSKRREPFQGLLLRETPSQSRLVEHFHFVGERKGKGEVVN